MELIPVIVFFVLAPRLGAPILEAMSGVSLNSGMVLAAEDEESDAVLLQLAFGRAKAAHKLVVVRDGQEAVEYLRGFSIYADRDRYPLPSLLLLDLKMPRMNGFEVLAWLGEHSEFKYLPVVVLSSSSHESDIARARQLGACDYHIKPHGMPQFVQLIKQLMKGSLAGATVGAGAYQECR